MRAIVYVLFIWLLALSLATAAQYARIGSSRAGARADNRAVWRAVVCSIEAQELKNPKVTAAQRADAVKFWTELLVNRVHTSPCD